MSLISRRQFAAFLTAGWAKAKVFAANSAMHIQNRRLVELQSGSIKLEKWERQHLHKCVECQEVLYFFVTQPSRHS